MNLFHSIPDLKFLTKNGSLLKNKNLTLFYRHIPYGIAWKKKRQNKTIKELTTTTNKNNKNNFFIYIKYIKTAHIT